MQVAGINVKLIGEANDYVGKGMAGGDITIVPPPDQNIDVRGSTSFAHSHLLKQNSLMLPAGAGNHGMQGCSI